MAVLWRPLSCASGILIQGCRLLPFLLLYSAAFNGYALSLQRIEALQQQQLPQLALALLEQHQPSLNDESSPEQWWLWEQQRLALYQQLQLWPQLIERHRLYPSAIQQRRTVAQRFDLAFALLQQQQPQQAYRLVTAEIWQSQPQPTTTELQRWRRLLIDIYLQQGHTLSALAALRRYQLDYGLSDAELTLQLEVLLTNNHLELAEQLWQLQATRRDLSEELRFWGEIITLQQRHQLPQRLASLTSRLKQPREPRLQRRDLLLLAMTATLTDSYRIAIEAQEQLLTLGWPDERERRWVGMSNDSLWQSYLTYAEIVANEQQLLVGDDRAWLRLAKAQQGITSRALYLWLLLNSTDERLRQRAGFELLQQLQHSPFGDPLLIYLYQHQRQPWLTSALQRQLIDAALSQQQLPLADQLLTELAPESGASIKLTTLLYRIRLAVQLQRPEEAKQLLLKLLPSLPKGDNESYDRLMQLLFELQEQAPEATLTLLYQLKEQIPDPKRQREYHFWLGDAHAALNEPLLAAAAYLHSAAFNGMSERDDMWGQTARYRAAQMLRQAQLLEDAEQLLQQLLTLADTEPQRQIVQQELKQLQQQRLKLNLEKGQ
ncbi:hypothetical protein D5085_07240 [Ectothiorhodospiraceae bacterium BW-2]|nr:hypothetical protein D5085_07240 [Ectothiorhodospiraceae bacterium BW-2]